MAASNATFGASFEWSSNTFTAGTIASRIVFSPGFEPALFIILSVPALIASANSTRSNVSLPLSAAAIPFMKKERMVPRLLGASLLNTSAAKPRTFPTSFSSVSLTDLNAPWNPVFTEMPRSPSPIFWSSSVSSSTFPEIFSNMFSNATSNEWTFISSSASFYLLWLV